MSAEERQRAAYERLAKARVRLEEADDHADRVALEGIDTLAEREAERLAYEARVEHQEALNEALAIDGEILAELEAEAKALTPRGGA